MITLAMDTSHRFLALAVFEDDTLRNGVLLDCPKKQSEEIFPQLISMLEEANISQSDIDQVVITRGPGSYTGLRIAMTIAKVFCSQKEIPLYTLSTLALYGGLNDCRVVLDARGGRVYTARYQEGKVLEEVSVKEIDKVEVEDIELIGDTDLYPNWKEEYKKGYPNFLENFILLKDQWEKAENVHLLTPEYLKDQEAYLIKEEKK